MTKSGDRAQSKLIRAQRNRRIGKTIQSRRSRRADREWGKSGLRQLEEQKLGELKSKSGELSERFENKLKTVRFSDSGLKQSDQWRTGLAKLSEKAWRLKLANVDQAISILAPTNIGKSARQTLLNRLQSQTARYTALEQLFRELTAFGQVLARSRKSNRKR